MTTFSIVIPTYNRADAVLRAVASAANQSYAPIEVIVVNDGSTDHTAQVLEKALEQYETLHLINQSNAERGAARNRGMEAARGDYIVFCDSDDELHPDCLRHYNDYIGSLDEPPALIAGQVFFCRQGKTRLHRDLPRKSGIYDHRLFLKGNPFGNNFCVKRSIGLRYEESREMATSEDWLFLLKSSKNYGLHYIDKPAVTMHLHADRSMGDSKKVITARKLAAKQVLREIDLTDPERNTLLYNSALFCAIHHTDNHNRKLALSELLTALKYRLPGIKWFYTLYRTLK